MATSLTTKTLLLASAVLFCLLQGRLWFSDDGWSEVVRLRASVEAQQAENAAYGQRNTRLQAEVSDLKTGVAALEERARADLGMIAKGESFFVWSADPVAASATRSGGAAAATPPAETD
jgi:cell division protein FtsB